MPSRAAPSVATTAPADSGDNDAALLHAGAGLCCAHAVLHSALVFIACLALVAAGMGSEDAPVLAEAPRARVYNMTGTGPDVRRRRVELSGLGATIGGSSELRHGSSLGSLAGCERFELPRALAPPRADARFALFVVLAPLLGGICLTCLVECNRPGVNVKRCVRVLVLGIAAAACALMWVPASRALGVRRELRGGAMVPPFAPCPGSVAVRAGNTWAEGGFTATVHVTAPITLAALCTVATGVAVGAGVAVCATEAWVARAEDGAGGAAEQSRAAPSAAPAVPYGATSPRQQRKQKQARRVVASPAPLPREDSGLPGVPQCPVCMRGIPVGLVCLPHRAPVGDVSEHAVCAACIAELSKRGQAGRCPMCRGALAPFRAVSCSPH